MSNRTNDLKTKKILSSTHRIHPCALDLSFLTQKGINQTFILPPPPLSTVLLYKHFTKVIHTLLYYCYCHVICFFNAVASSHPIVEFFSMGNYMFILKMNYSLNPPTPPHPTSHFNPLSLPPQKMG